MKVVGFVLNYVPLQNYFGCLFNQKLSDSALSRIVPSNLQNRVSENLHEENLIINNNNINLILPVSILDAHQYNVVEYIGNYIYVYIRVEILDFSNLKIDGKIIPYPNYGEWMDILYIFVFKNVF